MSSQDQEPKEFLTFALTSTLTSLFHEYERLLGAGELIRFRELMMELLQENERLFEVAKSYEK